MNIKKITADILIIGGGTAGCYAAITLSKISGARTLICEKADIRRSGCLAAGVNALNAYITEGHTPEFYADYAMKDAHGIARYDLLLSMSKRLNSVTAELEKLGLVILKDENGKYVTRGARNIKINGENIKPILADAVNALPNTDVLNRVNITDLAVRGNKIIGAYGIGVEDEAFYVIEAKAVIMAAGGAAGLYRPNNPGFSRHKMWYPPFNTGAGYAMGIRAGAEMTTFEMRFIALRCKDTIAPTGTLAQGVGAEQVNSLGEAYDDKYGHSTSDRVYGTVVENTEGRGPCFLRTEGITPEQEDDLKKAYLNMAPSQTLKWIEEGGPREKNVEIEGTEPYITGGHTASGYWVDINRKTTIDGLYAAGDAAGGAPQKYVTGALAEGEIAAEAAAEYIKSIKAAKIDETDISAHIAEAARFLDKSDKPSFTAEQLEEEMQKVMDEYAGGISANYRYDKARLDAADEKIRRIFELSELLRASDFYELMQIYELRERLTVALSVIAHLGARHETRWHCFAENVDYPGRDDKNFNKFVNSRLVNGKIEIILRDIPKGGASE